MRNTFIIARREYLERVKTRSFIVMTILIPALMFVVTVVPSLIMMRGSGETKHYVVVASNAGTGELVRDQLTKASQEQNKDSSQSTGMGKRNMPQKLNLVVDVSTDTSHASRAALTEKVKQKQLDGAIFATDDALAARKVSFITRDISSFMIQEQVKSGITQAVRSGFLQSKGLTQPEIEAALKPVELEAPTGNPLAVYITVICLVMIMYVTVLLYGINVMRAILEEKTSRVMEVMLASARPMEMMAGKILGVGAVGLTQIAIWAFTGIVFASFNLVGAGANIKGVLSVKLLIFFGVFFLLGYILYSTLCAAIGAMVNSEQEAQQLHFELGLASLVKEQNAFRKGLAGETRP